MDKTDTLTEDTPGNSVAGTIERKPTQWQPEFSFNAIIEYRCGNCHKNIYYSCWRATYCPHCGASIFNFPRKKLDAEPHHDRTYSYLETLKYAGPGRTNGAKSERQAAPGLRSGAGARDKRHKRRTVP